MSRRLNHVLFLATLSLAGSLGACAGTQPPAPKPLWGSEWRLQEIGGQATASQSAATLSFPQTGRVAGNGSCNRFSGTVDIDRDRLKMGPLMSTKMACPGGASELESRYLGALQNAQRYELVEGSLLIYVKGMEHPLKFLRNPPH
ncbi:MAG: META domain-containing protein [Hydrogenophaga sp.]|nr:META domain-containing protein [Hydrogenophaga sp.]